MIKENKSQKSRPILRWFPFLVASQLDYKQAGIQLQGDTTQSNIHVYVCAEPFPICSNIGILNMALSIMTEKFMYMYAKHYFVSLILSLSNNSNISSSSFFPAGIFTNDSLLFFTFVQQTSCCILLPPIYLRAAHSS